MPWIGPTLALVAYLLGSVSFAILVAARHGVDPRTEGSHNPGATNVGRLVGKGAGRLVLVLDALKGFAPALAARLVLGGDHPLTAITAVAAVMGHVLPLWHGFRGGKGAATAAGALLAVVPWAGATAALVFVVLKKATRRASVGSLGGALSGALLTLGLEGPGVLSAMAGAIFLIVLLRHVDNLGRLLRGEEPPS